MGNKVIQGLIPVNPENNAIYAENITFANSTYSLNLLESKLSRITINTEFLIDYTFIFVARKVHEDDIGSIFTSTKPNRIFGWRNDGKAFKVGQGEATVGTYNEDTDLHCYIVVCTMSKIQFWDLDTKIGNTSVLENYGKVVIGKALQSLDTNDKGRGYFYELILFDRALPIEDPDGVETIKKFLKTFYDFKPKVKEVPVVDQSVLQNLSIK